MKYDVAQTIALDAFLWLAGEEELFLGFLGMTGANVDDLRTQSQNPEFLGFVLDYILSDDATVIACAQAIGVQPEKLPMARAYLPGGDIPNWT